MCEKYNTIKQEISMADLTLDSSFNNGFHLFCYVLSYLASKVSRLLQVDYLLDDISIVKRSVPLGRNPTFGLRFYVTEINQFIVN